ncbi:MAG: hypothetical protein ACO1OO_05265 [Flavisolibacter sp.]
MKFPIIIAVLFFMASSCSNQNKLDSGCFKGRLEIKGICSNYTIKLLEGNMAKGAIAETWTNESTGKEYTNVFSLENPCVLPASLEEGDEFYFTIDTTAPEECITCQAYYPKPAQKLHIKVLDKPCNP